MESACYDDELALRATREADSSAIGDVHLKMMTAVILASCVCAAPGIATAQTMQWTDKGFVSVNAGGQAASHELRSTTTFPIYGQNAVIESAQGIGGGVLFDFGAAYRVWGNNVLAAVSYSRASSDSDVALAASVPDPVVTNRPRSVTATVGGASHAENAIHLDLIWMMPVANRLDVGFFAGPTIFVVNQETVTTLDVAEPVPTVSASLDSVGKTTVGLNAGIDLQYMVTRKWGIGGLARYSWGSADFDGDSLTLGGFQLGAGVRVRF
jgi:hypothetical protein